MGYSGQLLWMILTLFSIQNHIFTNYKPKHYWNNYKQKATNTRLCCIRCFPCVQQLRVMNEIRIFLLRSLFERRWAPLWFGFSNWSFDSCDSGTSMSRQIKKQLQWKETNLTSSNIYRLRVKAMYHQSCLEILSVALLSFEAPSFLIL